MSTYPTKIIIGDGDNALVYDEDLILEISASQSGSIGFSKYNSAFCNVKLHNDGRLSDTVFENLKTLYPKIQIQVYFYGESEKLFGTYYIDEYNFKEDNAVISIESYDILYYMGLSMYGKGIVSLTNVNFDTLITDIVNDFNANSGMNVTFETYFGEIDYAKQSYIPYITHRDALFQIARSVSDGGRVYVKPDGTIFISDVRQVSTAINGFNKDRVEANSLVRDYSNDATGTINVGHSLALSKELIGIAEVSIADLTTSTITTTIEYSTYPAKVETVSTSSNITILSQTLYSDRAVFTYKGTNTEPGWITLTGYPYIDGKREFFKGDTTGNVVSFENNYLLGRTKYSMGAGNALSYYYSKPKYSFKIADIDYFNQMTEVPVCKQIEMFNLFDNIYYRVFFTEIIRTITSNNEEIEIKCFIRI